MSKHLSPEQFARCFSGTPAAADEQHLESCPHCRAELSRFGDTISGFRYAIRGRVDHQLETGSPGMSPVAIPRAWPGISLVGGVIVAAAIALAILPVPNSRRQDSSGSVIAGVSAKLDPDALMAAINIHLMRSVPAPMEPMFALVPSTDFTTESGGVR